jgi:hypothetical protein
MTKPTIILVNDTDHLQYQHAKVVFEHLNKYDIPFTHAIFYTLEKDLINETTLDKHCYEIETASLTDIDSHKYIQLLKEQVAIGNEVAYHGYSQISNPRDKFAKGIEKINEILNIKMTTYIEHGGNPNHHPIEGCKRETLAVEGNNVESEYYVQDLIKDNFSQCWCYFDLVDSKKEPLSPLSKDQVFYKREDLLMMRRHRALHLPTVAPKMKAGDVCIAYTHFGYKGYPPNQLMECWYTRESIVRNCIYLKYLRDNGYNLTTIDNYLNQQRDYNV